MIIELSHKCEECDGTGMVPVEYPENLPPKMATCDVCNGDGERTMITGDTNG